MRSEFLAGCRSQLPIRKGTMPIGMSFGVLAVSAGLSQSLAQSMSFIVFAGSSQFVGQGMLGAGDPALLIVLTTCIINLRHVLYSASVEPYIKHLPARWKYLLAYLLTDEAYATTIVRYRQGELRHAHWFFPRALRLVLVATSTAVG
jgi:4-azaleucine resistance transporter AzlC